MVKVHQNLDQNRNRNQNHDQDHVHFLQHHRMKKKTKPIFLNKQFSVFFFYRGRAAKARNWNGDSGYRLHVSPLNPRTSRRDIENLFAKFGTINEVHSSSFSIIFFLLKI
jgi:hypothetical protein